MTVESWPMNIFLSERRKAVYLLAISALCLSCGTSARAQHSGTAMLAPTPPMGWNSWDAYGTTIVESEVKAAADVMARDLKAFGWQYVVVDIQWSEPEPKAHGYRPGTHLTMDEYGRLMPAPNRFPSAANGAGFKALAEYAHSKGLKFGIHIMRGIPRQAVAANTPVFGTSFHATDIADTSSTCEWNTDMYGLDMTKPGAQAYYDSIVAMYASWGVDFIKADDMARPYHTAEIHGVHEAILKTGRPIVLSLSPGPAPEAEIAHLREDAQMWRIADDLWDDWKSEKEMYFRAEKWAPLVTEGHWPDADMLPLGNIGLRAERGDARSSRLTHDEQQTMMTLWAIFRSPLMFGGDLPTLDAYTKSLLTNADVLAVNQHSSGSRVAYSNGDVRIWTARGAKGETYIAVFNLGEAAAPVAAKWGGLGVLKVPAFEKNLWTGEETRAGGAVKVVVPAHGSMLFGVTE